MPEYYASIRLNTERVGQLEDTIRVIFRNLKNWYEPATFPNVAFVIGGWSSGGTVTDYGSIMGVDMQAAHELTPTHELNLWQQRNMLSFDNLKHIDRPSDLGYWVGYQICKAFFDQATDKKKAVYDMLNIRNYQAFLTESKVDEILSQRRKE